MAIPLTSKRRTDWPSVVLAVLLVAVAIAAVADASKSKEKICSRNFDCINSTYCCNQSIYDMFKYDDFERLFSKRNVPTCHANYFYDYQAFITAAAVYEPLGFCTIGGQQMQMQELAAFLGMVGCKTSCGYDVAPGGPLAYGLCYKNELSPSSDYCQEDDYLYPCTPGVDYRGRGCLPIFWNYNYGRLGRLLNMDLLNHPEILEQNATTSFQAAIVQWMTPKKKNQPSAHDCLVGNFKPSKADIEAKRVEGFGCAMNALYGDELCGQGFIDSMNSCISHYQYYLDLMGVGRQNSVANLNCAEQKPFNPTPPKKTS